MDFANELNIEASPSSAVHVILVKTENVAGEVFTDLLVLIFLTFWFIRPHLVNTITNAATKLTS